MRFNILWSQINILGKKTQSKYIVLVVVVMDEFVNEMNRKLISNHNKWLDKCVLDKFRT